MDGRPARRALLVSAGARRRERLRDELRREGYDVVSTCAGPDGDRHCPGMSHGSCGLTISVDVVMLDVASITGVGALQAFYASRDLPVRARGHHRG